MHEASNKTLILVRYVLPAVVVIGGILAVALNPNMTSVEGAAGVIGAGLSIALLNFLFRIGVRGDTERDAEQDARDYFDAHGHWPDEHAATPAQTR